MEPAATVLHLVPTPGLRLRLALNHVLGGAVLALTGLQSLLAREFGLLPALELTSGALMLGAVWREVRARDHGHEGEIVWVELFAGIMLAVEGLHLLHPHRWFQPATFYFLLAAVTIATAVGLLRLSRRMRLTIDARGFAFRITLRHRLAMDWRDVAAVAATDREVRVTTSRGEIRSFGLGMIENRAEAIAAFEAAARAHVAAPQPPAPGAPAAERP